MQSTSLYYGGSFNPIHNGHLRCSRAVAERLGLTRIWLVPSAQPPHKPADPNLASGPDRLRLCELAAATDPIFGVDDREMRRAGPSYTLTTVRDLKSEGVDPVRWLIGADMLRLLPKWHEAETLLNEVHFIIMARPGWDFDWGTMPAAFRRLEANVIEAPLVDLSATEIRDKVRNGQSIRGLVPQPVEQYIIERGLYRTLSSHHRANDRA